MSDTMPTMKDFEEMLFKEWSNPDDATTDPVIIIEDQVLSRRAADQGVTCHVTVISAQWPVSTPEERASAVVSVGTHADPNGTRNCTRWKGLTKEEAEEAGLNITFAHPDFNINKPHDSVEGSIAPMPLHTRS